MKHDALIQELNEKVFALNRLVSKENREEALRIMGDLGWIIASIDCELIKLSTSDAYNCL